MQHQLFADIAEKAVVQFETPSYFSFIIDSPQNSLIVIRPVNMGSALLAGF